MERDFLGLVTNNSSSPVIKYEIHDPCIDVDHYSVPQRGTGMQWYFPDSVLNSPPAVSSKSHEEVKPLRSSILDPVPSSRFMTASATDNYSHRKRISKQSGSQIGSSSPLEQSGAAYHPEIFKLHSFAHNLSETTSPATNYPVLQSHKFATEQRTGRSTSYSPSSGRVQSMSPASRVPSPTCFPTYTDTGSVRKHLTAPAQMTIFYAGSVSVYDNIAPEKAQAIMLLAGNDTPSTPAVSVNHVSIFSQIASQPGGVTNQRTMISSQQQPESSRVVHSQRLSSGYAIHGPVPQARKASLARFLERRKERVINSQPYPVELKLPEQERDN